MRKLSYMILLLMVTLFIGCSPAELQEDPVYVVDSEDIETQLVEEEIEAVDELVVIFKVVEIDESLKNKMDGVSFHDNDVIGWTDLRLVRVTHIGFDEKVHYGELVVHEAIAEDVMAIFQTLYEEKYPIEKINPVCMYEGDDTLSMADNNSSAFNYRVVSGTKKLSNHSYGLAIDINPLINPYVTSKGIYPKEGEKYVDRDPSVKGLIVEGDACYNAFVEKGFSWGGHWNSVKDYQHFEIKIEGINK